MSCSEWKEYRLEELCSIIDSLHKSPQYVEWGYPLVRVKDMEEGFLKLNQTAYVTKEVYEEFTRKHKPQKGDMLFSRVGSYGITTFVDLEEEFCLGQNTVVLTSYNNKIINNKFLFYMMISNIVKEQIELLVTGSTQKTISMKSIKSIVIPVPSLEEQEKIADILSSLDNKIELNNEMNKALEEMAQSIFKRWFVNFEFPNEYGQPYKSSGGDMVESELGMIPKGWEVKTIADVGEVISGGTPSTKNEDYYGGNISWITPKDLSGYDRKFISKGERSITELGLQKSSAKLLPKGTVLFSSRAPIGYVAIAEQEVCTNQGFKSIVCNNEIINNNYIYYFLKLNKENIENISSGSTFKEISGIHMKNINIIVPNKKILDKFNQLIISYDNLFSKNYEEIDSLIEIRDSLLPKLMSGNIKLNI